MSFGFYISLLFPKATHNQTLFWPTGRPRRWPFSLAFVAQLTARWSCDHGRLSKQRLSKQMCFWRNIELMQHFVDIWYESWFWEGGHENNIVFSKKSENWSYVICFWIPNFWRTLQLISNKDSLSSHNHNNNIKFLDEHEHEQPWDNLDPLQNRPFFKSFTSSFRSSRSSIFARWVFGRCAAGKLSKFQLRSLAFQRIPSEKP